MKKKGIGFRIVLMAVVLSTIAAVIGFIGLYATKTVSALVTEMYTKSVLGVEYAGMIQTNVETIRCELSGANLQGKTKQQTDTSLKNFRQEGTALNDSITKFESLNPTGEKQQLIQTIKTAAEDYLEKSERVYDFTYKNDLGGAAQYLTDVIATTRLQTLTPAIEKLIEVQVAESKAAYQSSLEMSFMSITVIIFAILIGLATSLTLGIIITRSITKPVSKIVTDLSESSSQINISSSQLSTASQEIANGAQEQASSIEETTSSMEELSSMVRQNLGSTRQASLLSEKATEASQNGYDKMADMLMAMNNISKSTEDIKNVIDVIDDIAFQTNMLALNAAVEAARAGEAGMGFAVVADEVKNLANRSSESAKETATMIKDTLKNVDSGMSISKELSEIFKDILSNSKKVMEMNREVETASGQQDEGINQVNKAMIQFDTVVQTNASSAEETASAAEELQSQVTGLNDIVDTLYLIVSGKNYDDRSDSEILSDRTLKERRIAAAVSERRVPSGHEQPKGKSADQKKPPETAQRKNTSQGKDPSQGKDAGQKAAGTDASETKNGHTISFENDEDFKPV